MLIIIWVIVNLIIIWRSRSLTSFYSRNGFDESEHEIESNYIQVENTM